MGKGAGRGPRKGGPKGRIGRGGIGPAAGNVAGNRNRGGTQHKPGTSTNGCAVVALAMVGAALAIPAAAIWELWRVIS